MRVVKIGDILAKLSELLKNTDADDAEPYWIVCHCLNCSRSNLDIFRVLKNNELC
ncbi:MAG: hypothetical protein LBU60_06285 [Clostridiales bacterium]|nr:hypothetical protein [Clostridiales bacterium]